MQRYLFLFLLLFSLHKSATAQNWRTINPTDTIYFKSNTILDNSYLRLIYVDSVRAISTDSNYYFYKAYRIPAETSASAVCVDTMAATWLGHSMLRKIDGTEFYFNYFNDTIQIKTLAVFGDSWQMAKDSFGTVFQGTVASAGTTIVDGISDSTKTITIQAYQNGNPVYGIYNNYVLELSKEHGWLKALDMYCFPYSLGNNPLIFGAVMDSTQHVRLNKDFGDGDMNNPNLAFKYMLGNEWICHYDYLDGSNPGPNHIITYDSVVNNIVLSATSMLVSFRTDSFSTYYSPAYPHVDTIIKTSTTLHTDTIRLAPPAPIKKNVLPEVRAGRYWITYGPAQPLPNTHFVLLGDTCSGKDLLRYSSSYVTMFKGSSCYSVQSTAALEGSSNDTTDILPGFGKLSQRIVSMGSSGATYKFRNTYYTYLKLSNCVRGVKKNILNDSPNGGQNNATIFLGPNPVQHTLTITAPGKNMACKIYDVTGKMVYSQQLVSENVTISTDFLQAGLYIIQTSGSSGKFTGKFIKL